MIRICRLPILPMVEYEKKMTKDSVSWLIKSQQYDYSRVTVFYIWQTNIQKHLPRKTVIHADRKKSI